MPNTIAESYVLTTGTESSGDVTDTDVLDGVYHEHTDDAGALDLYYQFDVEPDGVPNNVVVTGRLNGVGDDLDGVFAFDWGGAAWDRIGDFIGQGSVIDTTQTFPTLMRHVGTGANRGKVRFRFLAAAGLTTATLAVDQICCDFDVVVRSPGYEDGAIWIDTNGSNSNAVHPFDGTSDNPVNSWANLLTVAGISGHHRFRIVNGSAIVLSGNSGNYTLIGEHWTLDLNDQSIDNAYFEGADDVVGDGFGIGSEFVDCVMALSGSATVGESLLRGCGLSGEFGFNASGGGYILDQCFSLEPDTLSTKIDTGALIGDLRICVRHHSGAIEVENLGVLGTDVISVEGEGALTLGASCDGGTLRLSGNWLFTDNSGGAVTVTRDDDTNDLVNLKQRTPPAFQGIAFPNIPFLLVREADGRTPVTAAVGLSVERQIDGATFETADNTPTEVSDGMYSYDASAADMDGAKITFRFSASNGTPGEPGDTFVTILTGDAP